MTTFLLAMLLFTGPGRCGGKSGFSSSFLPEKMNRHRAKKLGRGALDYLQSHPFCKRRLSGHESGSSVLPTAERHEEP